MRSRKSLRVIVGLLIAVLFIFLAFKGISFPSLLHDALQANFLILLIGTLVGLLSLYVRSLRWRVILQEIRPTISKSDTWGSLMIGYMMNNFVPRLGEVVRAYTTSKVEDIGISGVLGTIVLERLFDMLSAGILFGIALATYGGSITGAFPFLRLAGGVLIFGSLIIGVALYVSTTSKKVNDLLMRFVRFITPGRFSHKVEEIVNSFLSSFSLLRSPRGLFHVTVYTILIWCVYTFQIYIPLLAFKSTSVLSLYDGFVLGMITTMAWLIPSPGALGVYHLFVSQTLIHLFEVAPDEALAYATLTHLFGYIAITIVGTIFAFIFTQRLKLRTVGKLFKTEEGKG